MDAVDLEALKDRLTGEIAALDAAADTLRKSAGAVCAAAHDMDRKASRKRGKLHRVQRQQAQISVLEAANEARARTAAAIPAEEEN